MGNFYAWCKNISHKKKRCVLQVQKSCVMCPKIYSKANSHGNPSLFPLLYEYLPHPNQALRQVFVQPLAPPSGFFGTPTTEDYNQQRANSPGRKDVGTQKRKVKFQNIIFQGLCQSTFCVVKNVNPIVVAAAFMADCWLGRSMVL